MHKFLILTVSALALLSCAPASDTSTKPATTKDVSAASVQSENERIDAWFEEAFQKGVAKYPQFMTQLGMKKDYDKWNDPSKVFYLNNLDETRQELEFMKANFNLDDLDETHALSYRLFEMNAEQDLEGADWWGYGYPFNQMFGAQSGIPSFLINYHRIDSEDDAMAYIARLNGVKEYLGGQVKNARESAANGIQPPTFVYDYVISDAKNVLVGAPFDDGAPSTLLADFTKKISDEKLGFSDEKKEELIAGASTALTDSFKPAFENLIAEMNDQKASSNTDDGAWKLPKGDAFYKRRLKMMTTTDM